MQMKMKFRIVVFLNKIIFVSSSYCLKFLSPELIKPEKYIEEIISRFPICNSVNFKYFQMNQQFHTQTCSLSSQDSGYDADNVRIRARTGTDGLSSNNLPKHSDQDKINLEDMNHSTKKSNTERKSIF
jgi:hypothetical protein